MSNTEGAGEHKWCPACGKMLEPGTVVCTRCGRNLRTGRSARTLVTPKRAAGRVGPGLVLSAAAASAGGAGWGLLTAGVGVPLGYVAIAVGLLSGGAFLLLARRRSAELAFVVAGIALVGLIIGKVAAISGDVPRLAAARAKDDRLVREGMVEDMRAKNEIEPEVAEIMLDEEATVPPGEMKKRYERADARIKKRMAGLTWEQRQRLARASAEQFIDQLGLAERVRRRFSPWDALWFLLALVAAGRLAYGRGPGH